MSETTYRQILEGPRLAGFSTAIKDYCWENNIDLKIEVDKGWLRETIRLSVTGPEYKIKHFKKALNDTMERWNAPSYS